MEQQNLTPTPASQWKGRVEVEGTDLLLPSENVARVRQMSPQAFLTAGVIPDPLSQIIRKAINTKKGLPPSAMKEVTDDPDKIASALEMFDRVLERVMIEPEVRMPPPCKNCSEYANKPQHRDQSLPEYHRYQEADREEGILYADVVDQTDKMFIFQWVMGGTRDLERFRNELAGSLESVPDGKDVSSKAKRPAGRRR